MRNLIPFLPRRPPVTNRPRKAVIALGGGGARGLAHLGALEAIGQTQIQCERYVGISIGALVGAMCALEPDVRRVQSRAVEFLTSPDFLHHQEQLFGSTGVSNEKAESGMMAWFHRARYLYSAHRRLTRAVTQQALMPAAILHASIDELIPNVDFADLAVPLSIVAADLRSGHRVVLESGSVRRAVQASMALPGIFPPVEIDDMLLSDIGVVDSVPTTVALCDASDLTIAIDIGQHTASIQNFDTALDVMMRMQDIGEQIIRREKTQLADIHIRPELAEVSWFDFRHPERIIEQGRVAAWEQLTRHSFFRVDTHEPSKDAVDDATG